MYSFLEMLSYFVKLLQKMGETNFLSFKYLLSKTSKPMANYILMSSIILLQSATTTNFKHRIVVLDILEKKCGLEYALFNSI